MKCFFEHRLYARHCVGSFVHICGSQLFFWHASELPGGFVCWALVFNWAGLGWDPSICISSTLPGDAAIAEPGTTL